MMANAASFTAPSSDFVLIKGGSFTMGSPENEDWRSNDETLHSVTVASFYMAKFEVTQKEWREITGKNPSKTQRLRMTIDITMTIFSIILMGGNYLFPADIVHEILGVALFVLWAVHITLNRRRLPCRKLKIFIFLL